MIKNAVAIALLVIMAPAGLVMLAVPVLALLAPWIILVRWMMGS